MLFQRSLEFPHIRRSRIRASAETRVHPVDSVACFDGAVEDVDAFLDLVVYLGIRCQGWLNAVSGL